jgi:hypothetical protein
MQLREFKQIAFPVSEEDLGLNGVGSAFNFMMHRLQSQEMKFGNGVVSREDGVLYHHLGTLNKFYEKKLQNI